MVHRQSISGGVQEAGMRGGAHGTAGGSSGSETREGLYRNGMSGGLGGVAGDGERVTIGSVMKGISGGILPRSPCAGISVSGTFSLTSG
jgi:hypothetical protein